MSRFIGLDVHMASITVAARGPTGRRIREEVVQTDGPSLIRVIRKIPGPRFLCLEEGELSTWIYELLSPLAEKIVVIQPPRREGKKSDSIDAWELADRVFRNDTRGAVFKAVQRFTALREAVKAHDKVLRDVVRAKNRLKAVYRTRGIAVTGQQVYSDPEAWLPRLQKPHRRHAELAYDQVLAMTELAERAEEWLLEEGKKVPEVRLLETAPGIGPVRAAQIVATVVTPHRFRTKKQFWSYCGLAVVTRSTSDWVWQDGSLQRRRVHQTRGLNRNRNAILKNAFKGAALTVVVRMSKHPLHLQYKQMLDSGMKPTLAQLTLARRISASVLAMLKKGEEYNPPTHE